MSENQEKVKCPKCGVLVAKGTEQCPKCGGLLLENKFRGKKKVYCVNEKCGYEETKETKSK